MLVGDTGCNLINGNGAFFFFLFLMDAKVPFFFFWCIEDVCFERSGVHGSTVCCTREICVFVVVEMNGDGFLYI